MTVPKSFFNQPQTCAFLANDVYTAHWPNKQTSEAQITTKVKFPQRMLKLWKK